MSIKMLKFTSLLMALAIALAACGGNAAPAPTAASNTVDSSGGATATSNPDLARANSTTQSPCIGVQPVAGENIQPNGGGKWSAPDNVIDATHVYCAIFTTNNGRIV